MIQKILRFTKIEHTIFSLPMLFAGAWIGKNGDLPSINLLLLIIVAAIGARIFGMAFNRIFDRKIDAKNPRTALRELPIGQMSVKAALIIAFTGLAVYLTVCIILGQWCLIFSWIPLIPLLGYSLLKRFTCLCHFGIGLCLAIAPIGAFVATTNDLRFTKEIIIFSFFVFCWMSGSDIIYAMLDIESDRKNNIYSLPANIGVYKAQKIAGVFHFLAVICMIHILMLTNGGIGAWIAVFVSVTAFILMYIPMIPIMIRFFPISSIAGIAGAMVPILGAW